MLHQVEAILAARRILAIVVDIDLRLALHIMVVYIIVVLLGLHHLLQVVVVGHAYLYGIRIGLAEIGLGIVSHIVVVLIPEERVGSQVVFLTVDMALSVCCCTEQLPSTTCHLVGTWCYVRLTKSYLATRQYQLRSLDVLDKRHTALEVDVDVHHMALADWCNVTACVALLVVVLIDGGDNLLLREVEDVRLTTYVERRGLGRSNTVDGEVLLIVR